MQTAFPNGSSRRLGAAVKRAIRSDRPAEALLTGWLDDFATYITFFPGGPARLLRALRSRDPLWTRRWTIVTQAHQQVLDKLTQSVAADVDATRLMILACSVAASAEEAGRRTDTATGRR